MPAVYSRGWCGTINGVEVNGLEAWLQMLIDTKVCVYAVGQSEMGASGNVHWQVYVITKRNPNNANGFTLTWVKKNIHASAHWEKRFGSHEQARDYCMKDATRHIDLDSGPFEVGEWSANAGDRISPAARQAGGAKHKQSCESLLARVEDGATDLELMREFPRLFFTMTKGIEKARLVLAQQAPREQPKVIVLHGPTGTGKSHLANEIMAANGGGFVFRKGNSGNMWADGYDPLRHPVVWFDEMDGSFMPYRQLLRVCDRWPLVLDTKGGAVNFNPKIVIFTASKAPKEWYSVEAVPDTTELMRRLTGKHGVIKHMTTVFVPLADDTPDLVDLFDALCDGSLLAQQKLVIDLTCSEDELTASDVVDDIVDEIEQGGRDFYGEGDDVEDGYDGRFGTDEEAIALAEQQAAEDLEEIALRDGRLPEHRLKRTLSFHKETPVQGQFKKLGSAPTQSVLYARGVRNSRSEDSKEVREWVEKEERKRLGSRQDDDDE